MTKREKQTIVVGVLVLAAAAIFHIFIKPSLARIKTLERVVIEKQQELGKLCNTSLQYNSISKELENIQSQISPHGEDKQILSFIERLQKECGIMKNVVYIKPVTSPLDSTYEKTTVEMKLQALTLQQLTRFLSELESSTVLLRIKSVEIKRQIQNSGLLDTVIKIITIST